jgi:hypothetical protein
LSWSTFLDRTIINLTKLELIYFELDQVQTDFLYQAMTCPIRRSNVHSLSIRQCYFQDAESVGLFQAMILLGPITTLQLWGHLRSAFFTEDDEQDVLTQLVVCLVLSMTRQSRAAAHTSGIDPEASNDAATDLKFHNLQNLDCTTIGTNIWEELSMNETIEYVHTSPLEACDKSIVTYVPKLQFSLRTIIMQVVNSKPLQESKRIAKRFLTAFQRNLFLEKVILHDTDGNFFHIVQIRYYCSRNIFIRKLLQISSSYYGKKVNPTTTHEIKDSMNNLVATKSSKETEGDPLKPIQQTELEDNDDKALKEILDPAWPNVLDCVVKSDANNRHQILYQLLNRFLITTIGTNCIKSTKRKVEMVETAPTLPQNQKKCHHS